jgi:hypothetical protein
VGFISQATGRDYLEKEDFELARKQVYQVWEQGLNSKGGILEMLKELLLRGFDDTTSSEREQAQ